MEPNDDRERANYIIIEELKRRRMTLQQQIAKLALEEQGLIKQIETKEHSPALLLPIHVSANSYRWVDGGYVGGYEEQHKTVHVYADCGDLSLAYILARARLPQSLGYSSGGRLIQGLSVDKEFSGTNSFTEVALDRVVIDESWERPNKEMLSLWEEAKVEGRKIMAQLLDDIILTNHYEDIPIRINREELYDVLLRQKVSALCMESELLIEREYPQKDNIGV